MGVVGSSDGRPTQQSYAVFTELSRQLDRELATLKRSLDAALPRLNGMLRDAGLPAIEAKPVDAPPPRQIAERVSLLPWLRNRFDAHPHRVVALVDVDGRAGDAAGQR